MKDHCKNDCSRLQDVETTVLVIDIPKEMLELYILSIISLQWKLLMTAIYCVDENGILCTSEPVDELSTATNLLEAYQLCGNKKKGRKSSWNNIYHSVKMCNEIAHFTLTIIKQFIYAVENALYTLAEEGFQLFSPWQVRHNTQRVNYLM